MNVFSMSSLSYGGSHYKGLNVVKMARVSCCYWARNFVFENTFQQVEYFLLMLS